MDENISGYTKDSRVIAIIFLITAAFSGVLYNTMRQIPDQKSYDYSLLEIAEKSHFIGCAKASGNLPVCEQLSKQFRKRFAESLKIEDPDEG